MKTALAKNIRFAKKARRGERGAARTVLLALISFLLGVGVTAWWFHRAGNAAEAVSQTPAAERIGLPAPPPPAPAAIPQPQDPAVIAEVKAVVPNFDSLSLEDGENILRAKALKDFAAAAAQTDAQIKAAEQQLQDAQNGQSAAEQQAAMKHVQDTQLAGLEKLKDMAAQLQAQISALKSLKNQPQ